jgi:uncharacterized protein (TIGR02452 family)
MYQRGSQSPFYTDYMIYSPSVPYFRADDGRLLEEPLIVSIITSAAVNASECVSGHQRSQIEPVMTERIRKIIQLAIQERNRVLVLGAFGCGVFGNDPDMVARIQRRLLFDEGLGQHFDVVVNPIPASRNLEAFRRVLG